MKHLIIQITLGIVLTVAAWFLTFLLIFSSGGNTVSLGENCVILIAGLLHLTWLIPYLIFFTKHQNSKGIRSSFIVFCIFWMPWVINKFHTPKFDSEQWKTSISTHYSFEGGRCPAHASGTMVTDIVESKILIGKNLNQIEELLGKRNIIREASDSTDPSYTYTMTSSKEGFAEISYYYSNGNLFDLCDELLLIMENNVCKEVFIADCD